MPSLQVVELVLVQCNLVDHQYQQKYEKLLRLKNLTLICQMLNQAI